MFSESPMDAFPCLCFIFIPILSNSYMVSPCSYLITNYFSFFTLSFKHCSSLFSLCTALKTLRVLLSNHSFILSFFPILTLCFSISPCCCDSLHLPCPLGSLSFHLAGSHPPLVSLSLFYILLMGSRWPRSVRRD